MVAPCLRNFFWTAEDYIVMACAESILLSTSKDPSICMNGEQITVMNDVPWERNDSVEGVPSGELSSPHFDETAVAEAQPVEPLPPSRFGLSHLSYEPIAIIAAFGLILMMVAAAAGFLMTRSQRDAAHEAAASQPQSATTEPAQREPTPLPVIERAAAAVTAAAHDAHSARPRRVGTHLRAPNRIVPALLDDAGDAGRPVARKVGEIRGRSSDRP
jgi:hypothetical protein